MFTIVCHNSTISIFKKYSPWYHRHKFRTYVTVTLCGCINYSWMTLGFSIPQIVQFCLLIYPLSWKWASLLNMILLENCHQHGGFLTPNKWNWWIVMNTIAQCQLYFKMVNILVTNCHIVSIFKIDFTIKIQLSWISLYNLIHQYLTMTYLKYQLFIFQKEKNIANLKI